MNELLFKQNEDKSVVLNIAKSCIEGVVPKYKGGFDCKVESPSKGILFSDKETISLSRVSKRDESEIENLFSEAFRFEAAGLGVDFCIEALGLDYDALQERINYVNRVIRYEQKRSGL